MAPPPRPCSRRRSSAKAQVVAAGHNPMDIKRGIDKAVEAVVGELKKISKPTARTKDIAQGRHDLRQRRHHIGNIIADAMEKVGKEGVITVEEAKAMENRASKSSKACSSTAATSRHTSSRTPSSDGRSAGRPVHPDQREEDLSMQELLPLLEKRRARRRAAPDHRGRRRRRGARDAGREQAPRNLSSCAGESPGLRRSPQGDARRHRASLTGGEVDQRRARHQAREPSTSEQLGRAKKHHDRQRQHHHRRRRRRQERTSKARVKQIRAQIEEARPPITIARSFKSVSRSSPAASR